MKVITNKNRKSDLEYFLEISVDLMAIIGKDGVKEKIFIPLNEEEKNKLINSMKIIKDAIIKKEV